MKSAEQPSYSIALVDDEPRIHETVAQILSDAGLMAKRHSFEEPVGFLEFLKSGQDTPDLVLLDVHFENAGLSGVDILPFIREEHPTLPVILLTGMDADAMQEAEEDEFTYYIPKPVSPDQLVRMVKFYMRKSQKTGALVEQLQSEIKDFQEYQQLLEAELANRQQEKPETAETGREKGPSKSFDKIREILSTLLVQSEIMPSMIDDLQDIHDTQFNMFKKVIETLVRFDVADASNPGLDIHKHKGTEHIYTARLSVKVRLYYYRSPKSSKKRLLRLDTVHDNKRMDKWLKNNYESYAD